MSRPFACLLGTLIAVTSACDEGFTPPSNLGLLDVTPSTTSELADGAATVLITARIDTTARLLNATVNFLTTAGTFATGNASAASANDSGFARVVLKAPLEPATAIVTATAAGVTKSTTISFAVAPPSGLSLLPESFRIDASPGSATKLTATLFRARGAPSPGAVVHFSMSRVGVGTVPGHLTADSAFAVGNMATTTFVVDSAVAAAVVFQARFTRAGQTDISDETVVRIAPKGS